MRPILAALALALSAITAHAVPVTISFDDEANDPALVASYEVVLLETPEGADKPSRIPIASVPADARQVTVDVAPGVRRIAIAAITPEGLRSPDSVPIQFLVPLPPTNLRLVIEVTVPTE